jgi:hypothetical protein
MATFPHQNARITQGMYLLLFLTGISVEMSK